MLNGTRRPSARFSLAMPSTVIRSHSYDAGRQELAILFTTGRLYLYHRVPPEAYEELLAAFSKGRHFNAHIRDAYDYTECAAQPAVT